MYLYINIFSFNEIIYELLLIYKNGFAILSVSRYNNN